MRVVVVGGAGFIGSAMSRFLVAQRGAHVLVIDKISAVSTLASLEPVARNPRYTSRRADIRDRERITALIQAFAPDSIVHAAIERAVDSRIGGAQDAFDTNLSGSWQLLEAAREYWSALPEPQRSRFRFLSASSLEHPTSQAIALRLAADQMMSGWQRSCGLPVIVAKAARTYGAYQSPGEAVPAAIVAAIDGAEIESLDVGTQDWLHVDDHVRALAAMLERGQPGETYNVHGCGAVGSVEMAERIARLVRRHQPRSSSVRAIDVRSDRSSEAPRIIASDRAIEDIGWYQEQTLQSGLADTVRWYLANPAWWQPLLAARTGGDRFGLLRSA